MKRHLLFIIGLLCLPLWALAQTDGYNPDNPPQPNWPEDDETTYYHITTEAIPAGAGSFGGYANQDVKAGTKVYVLANDQAGNIFQAWKDAEGNTLTTEREYNFTMPAGNITLYAVYTYDPASPANPEYIGQYLLSLVCEPAVAGSFNFQDKKVTEGEQQSLYAYKNNGFQFVNWTNENGDVLGTEQSLQYLMPSHASTLTAHFVYAPEVPQNPGTNLWDATLGELSMDFFTPGNLNSAMTQMVGGSDNRSAVTRLLVDGELTSNDFQWANYFQNVVYADLSRVGGVAAIPAYAFDGKLAALEEMEISDAVASIGSYAFRGCTSLRILDCYAMAPPVLGNDVFSGVPEDLTVFVPEDAVDLYKAADGWKDFTILPLRSRICSMEITLPEGNYKNLALEIVNVKSGQKYKYVITDHAIYTFPNLIRNTTYRAYVKTGSGKVLVETENIVIDDELVAVNIPQILLPSTANVAIYDATSQNVTASTTWNWLDANDKLLASNGALTDLVVGESVTAEVTLNEALSKVYQQPEALQLKVEELGKDYVLDCQLQAIPTYNVQFVVKGKTEGDKLHNLPAYTITVDEIFAGKYHSLSHLDQTVAADYRHPVHQVPTVVTIQAQDYAPVVDTLLLEGEQTDITLNYALELLEDQVTGNISFTYQPTVVEGQTPETQNHYADYASVSYALKNVTTDKAITDFTALYPQLVINSGASIGDEISITAHSNSGDFDDTKVNVQIPENRRISCAFPIVQKGGIQARFSVTDNSAVKALLFDVTNKLVQQSLYANFNPKALGGTDANDLTLSGLSAGTYTLITMGDSKFFSSLFDLSRFAELGLVENVDYVKDIVEVTPGVLKKVNNAVIPLFQESKFYYTGTNTSFAANKSNIIQGNYLTLNARLDFLADVRDQVSEVELVFPLPANCDFVNSSLIIGKSIAENSQYQYVDNRVLTDNVDANGLPYRVAHGEHVLTVQMGDSYTDRVKFCVVPFSRGNYTPTAYVRFKLNDQTILQPIGTTAYTVNDVTIWTPALVSKSTVFVNGNAPAFSRVDIYDGWEVIGQTTALADGYWQASCELIRPNNLSVHPIRAQILTPNGYPLYSECRLVEYNEKCIQAKTVDMRFYNDIVGRTVFVDFDLEHTTTNQPSYMFAPGTEFVFTADLTNNSPEVVESCVVRVFTNNHEWIELPAQYIENLDRWVAHGKFTNQSMPIGVRVEVDADISQEMDLTLMNPEQELPTGTVYELVTVEDAGLNGSMFFNNPQNVNWEDYDAETLEVDSEEDYEADIAVADDGSFVVSVTEGENAQPTVWGYDAGTPNESPNEAPCRRDTQKRIDTDLNDMLKDAIRQLTDLAPFLGFLTDKVAMEQASVPWSSIIFDYEQGSKKYTTEEYQDAKNKVAILQLFLDNIGNTLTLSRKVNLLLSYARYGIDDTNDWQELSDRFLPCDGIDDPQARSLNWTAQQYTRKHGVQYLVALEQAIMGIQLLHNLAYETNLSSVKASDVAALYENIQMTSGFITDFATGVYQQNKAASRNHMRWVKKQKNLLANCNYDMTETIDDHWDFTLPYPIVEPIIDPSGYVYEGVSSNRLEGVTATAYYRRTYEDIYGDLQQEVVLWDAENYGQENPLLTDEKGMYQWDVPQGEWQVKFEKDGYVTAYSEWLPVPPPQLDVNIAMTQQAQPEVVKARAFETGSTSDGGVEITFSKFMKPALLDAEHIFIKGIKDEVETLLEGLQFSFPDSEATIEGSEEQLATKVFVATDQLNQYDEVYIIVNRTVESYAGIQMAANYQQKIDIEKQLTSLSAETEMNVSYGGTETLLIAALPTEAAAGKHVRITSASSQVATLNDSQESIELTLDADGQAQVTVNGVLFGTTALKMEVVDEDIKAQTLVNVVEAALLEPVKAPTASRISGTAVYRGQTVTLQCESEGASIYYTTDGTCPCESATRKLYQEPITINEPMTINVMAVGYNGTESEVREYNYLIRQSALTLTLAEGWNWASHDLAEPLAKSVLQELATEMLTQEECTVIEAEQAVKLKAESQQVKQFAGDQYNPNSRGITLASGWNWLGYPIDQMLTLDDALRGLSADEGDVITNLTGGFAEYVDGAWTGLLQTMAPGEGYLYKAASQKSFVYNTVPTVNAQAKNEKHAKAAAPWSVSPRLYPNMMCVTAQVICNGELAEDNLYHVGAFIGEECRGVGEYVDGILYINIYGNDGDGAITFKAVDAETDEEQTLTAVLFEAAPTNATPITFQPDVLGSFKAPLQLQMEVETDISEAQKDQGPEVYYNLQGQRIYKPTQKGIYIRNGQKVVLKTRNR